MLTDTDIIDYIAARPSYDIRIYHNARWIDQKCTPDVLSMICDCINDYVLNNPGKTFTSQDIWHSNFAKTNVYDVFQKPDVDSKKAIAEYNKFFIQKSVFCNFITVTLIYQSSSAFYLFNCCRRT